MKLRSKTIVDLIFINTFFNQFDKNNKTTRGVILRKY